jgi:hypothetical protein
MKIVLAFDSYKGCLTAEEACCAAEEGVRRAGFCGEVVRVPLSDGGEGLVQCFLRIGKAREVRVKVHGPLMDEVEAVYAISEDGKTAFMEMASTCGLTLVPPERRNVMEATTYGLGEMMLDALHRGVRHIVLGIGGSATCDGGQGMLLALGLLDETDGVLPPPLNRHRRRRFTDVVEVGRPTSTMSVLEAQLKPPTNLSKEGRRSGREWETSVLAKNEEYRKGKTQRINTKAALAQFLDRL